MRDIKLTEPITVTLKAAEWYWLLGVLAFFSSQGDNGTMDKLYAQIMDATQ